MGISRLPTGARYLAAFSTLWKAATLPRFCVWVIGNLGGDCRDGACGSGTGKADTDRDRIIRPSKPLYSAYVEAPAVYDGPFRKPLRYKGHDYRAPCVVHVTQPLFGAVDAAGLRLNAAGQVVADALRAIHADRDGIGLDTCLVMPDHLHAIIVLGANPPSS